MYGDVRSSFAAGADCVRTVSSPTGPVPLGKRRGCEVGCQPTGCTSPGRAAIGSDGTGITVLRCTTGAGGSGVGSPAAIGATGLGSERTGGSVFARPAGIPGA